MEFKKTCAEGIRKITNFFKKNNRIHDVDQSDLHTEKSRIKELELTIAQQQLEIQQLYQKMASDEAVASRAIYWLQEKIQMQQWESKQQLLEIQQLNDQLASHDAAARRDISSLEVELKQMTNQMKDIKAETYILGHELDLYPASGRETKDSPPFVRDSGLKLTGSKTNATVKINNMTTGALLDTGSQVSIIKESFYRQSFNDQDLQPLKKNMSVKCANGGYLSYLGYVTAEVDLLGASTNRTLLCSMLVVPDNRYNKRVPVLLGTNLLQSAMDNVKLQFGHRLKNANICAPWFLSYMCLLLRENEDL